MELLFNDKTDKWQEAPEVYGTINCPTKKDYEYALNAIKTHKQLEAKHWDECRQIAHYDNDIKSLKAQIAEFKRCVKSDNSDYLTGYICALSSVEGMIEELIGE